MLNMYTSAADFSQNEDDDDDDSLYSYNSRFSGKLKHKPDKISLISTKLPMSDEEEDVKSSANPDSDLTGADPLIEDESDEFYADSGLINIIKDANAKSAPSSGSLLVDTMGLSAVGNSGSCASSSGVSSLPSCSSSSSSSSSSSCSSSSCSSVSSLTKKKRKQAPVLVSKVPDLSASSTSRLKKARVEQSLMASLAKQMVEFEPSSRAPGGASDVQLQLKVLCTGEYERFSVLFFKNKLGFFWGFGKSNLSKN
jgi:hypothetical protein